MIRAAIKVFPKVIALKKKAFQEKQKHLRAYESFSKALSRKVRHVQQSCHTGPSLACLPAWNVLSEKPLPKKLCESEWHAGAKQRPST